MGLECWFFEMMWRPAWDLATEISLGSSGASDARPSSSGLTTGSAVWQRLWKLHGGIRR